MRILKESFTEDEHQPVKIKQTSEGTHIDCQAMTTAELCRITIESNTKYEISPINIHQGELSTMYEFTVYNTQDMYIIISLLMGIGMELQQG